MRFVPIKSIAQQDIQAVLRIRSQLIQERTAKCNQIRELLAEYRVIVPQQIHNVRAKLPEISEDAGNELSSLMRRELSHIYQDLVGLDKRIKEQDQSIQEIFDSNEDCKRIAEIEKIGLITATAIVSAIGNPESFKNGREFSAWLGLVPRQSSSGNKQQLLGISKRGDRYIRSLLVHGARSVVSRAGGKDDKRSAWISAIKHRRGTNKACVALANKNARIVWAVLRNCVAYKKAA